VNNKKAPNLYGMGLLACFVTLEVEKSNFYRDINGMLEWNEPSKIPSEERE
jgi:hypothetical protein